MLPTPQTNRLESGSVLLLIFVIVGTFGGVVFCNDLVAVLEPYRIVNCALCAPTIASFYKSNECAALLCNIDYDW